MAKIALLALAIVLVLAVGRMLRLAQTRTADKARNDRQRLVLCKACGDYYPQGEECGCRAHSQ